MLFDRNRNMIFHRQYLLAAPWIRENIVQAFTWKGTWSSASKWFFSAKRALTRPLSRFIPFPATVTSNLIFLFQANNNAMRTRIRKIAAALLYIKTLNLAQNTALLLKIQITIVNISFVWYNEQRINNGSRCTKLHWTERVLTSTLRSTLAYFSM